MSAPPLTSEHARRVQAVLDAAGLGARVRELAEPVRTAQAAADAVGCTVAQIVKSLVFVRADGRAVLVVASGAHRVSEAKLAALLGGPVTMAGPDQVRAATGFPIGGVAPVAHPRPLDTLIDQHLLSLDALWAAAGHPNSLFPLTPAELVRLTGGRVADLA